MSQGPGKYDEICVRALAETQSAGVILIVLGGNQGSGFAVNTVDPEITKKLPDLLEHVAREIRKDCEGAGGQDPNVVRKYQDEEKLS